MERTLKPCRHFGTGQLRSPLSAPAVLSVFGERTGPAAPPDPPAVNDPDEVGAPS
jgi:hypothetical protein